MKDFELSTSGNFKIKEECERLLIYVPDFLSQLQNDYFALCNMLSGWQRERLSFYGRNYYLPRLTLWFSKEQLGYKYSGIQMDSKPYPKFLGEISDKVCNFTKQNFNGVLLNKYRNGLDKVGWHSDNERCLGETINVATISLGTTRTFFAKKSNGKKRLELDLKPGSLLIMQHPFQNEWLHCIPARPKVRNPRISLTFRKIETPEESE